ncbi:MAG: D-alanyl-D-alanine carboxypeptidase [Clostridia bacterium]|nr:D-alanyl-D-alanine carboxypeptidase [Clostridia bacterium]
MKHRRTAAAFYALFLLLLGVIPLLTYMVSAEATTPPSMEEADAVWFSHMESGKLVASKSENTPVGAGSSVKVMSGLLLCELADGKTDEQIYVSDELNALLKSKSGGHQLGLILHDKLYVKDLLYAAVCGSYNDAFYALAYGLCGGDLDAFLEKMNQRADEIGMTNTDFKDLTGYNSGSYTTAADMAKLASVAYQNETYMKIASYKDSYKCFSDKNSSIAFYNNNALVSSNKETQYYEPYCLGMSAGSTTTDGNCVVTVSKHENETYICVVLGGEERTAGGVLTKYGYKITNRLIDWVYSTYSYVEILSPKTELGTVPVAVSDLTTSVKVHTDETLYAYLPAGAEEDITYSIRLTNDEVEAPFDENTFVGYVAVIYEGHVLGTANLYTSAGAERSSIIGGLKFIQAWLKNRAVIAGLVFFMVTLVTWIIIEYVLWRRRRKKWDKYFSDKMQIPDRMLKPKGDPNRLRRNDSNSNKR